MANQFPTTGTMEGDIKAGYIKNGVYQPTVQPTPASSTGSLQGTMTTPQTPQQPAQQTQLPQPTMNLGLFGRAMDEIRSKLGQNQDLVDQKNKMFTLLYDRKLTPQELSTLTPSQQRAIESNNTGLIQGQLRIINDTLQGRTQSLDKSISYLTDLYEKDLERAETEKNNAMETILEYSTSLGQKPSVVAEALGFDQSLGLKLDSLVAPLLKTSGGSSSGVSGVSSLGGGKLSSQAQAIIDGTLRLEDLTPTVRGQIAGELTAAGYKSGPKLSSGQQDDISHMDTVSGLISQILDYNADGKLEGVGYLTGPLGATSTKIFGTGSEEAKNVRVLIGNIKATIAKLRGGTSFTPNEEKLLESYTPTINESATSALTKLSLLQDFIRAKKTNTLLTAQDRGVPTSSSVESLRSKYNY